MSPLSRHRFRLALGAGIGQLGRAMTSHRLKHIFQGLIAAFPIALGYFPIAFAFGASATGLGLTGIEAFALSLIIYAGAAQFLALVLIGSGAPLLVSALTLVAMNIRHVLYGPALLKRAGPKAQMRGAWLWAFGLTDEVFAAALGHLARDRPVSGAFMGGLGLGAYASWLGGTALGAYAGGGVLSEVPAVEAALGFMLPALFLALLLSILSRAQLGVILIAGGAAAVLALSWSATAGVLGGMLAGALAGMLGLGGRDET
jgi:4-azaleucine resistance transporter AzlC